MTTLPTRRLGTSGPEITTVGFGAWAAGGGGWAFAWGPQDDAESIAAIRHAVAQGVNWIDTAAVYGSATPRRSSAGRSPASPPPSGPSCSPSAACAGTSQDRMAAPGARLAPGARPRGVRGLAAAARRRGHRPLPVPLARPDGHAGRGLVGRDAAARGRGQGPLARASRTTTWPCSTAARRSGTCSPAAALLDDPPRRRGARDPLVRGARHRGRSSTARCSRGSSPTRFSAARAAALPADDWRRLSPHFQAPKLEQNLALRDALKPIAAKHGVTDGRGGGGLDAGLARRHRRHRGRAQPEAGGRLARGRGAAARRGRPRRDRRRDREHGRRARDRRRRPTRSAGPRPGPGRRRAGPATRRSRARPRSRR